MIKVPSAKMTDEEKSIESQSKKEQKDAWKQAKAVEIADEIEYKITPCEPRESLLGKDWWKYTVDFFWCGKKIYSESYHVEPDRVMIHKTIARLMFETKEGKELLEKEWQRDKQITQKWREEMAKKKKEKKDIEE